jgi:hypothetical protein
LRRWAGAAPPSAISRLLHLLTCSQRAWPWSVRHWHVEAQGHPLSAFLHCTPAPAALPQGDKSSWSRPIRSHPPPPQPASRSRCAGDFTTIGPHAIATIKTVVPVTFGSSRHTRRHNDPGPGPGQYPLPSSIGPQGANKRSMPSYRCVAGKCFCLLVGIFPSVAKAFLMSPSLISAAAGLGRLRGKRACTTSAAAAALAARCMQCGDGDVTAPGAT